MAVGFEWADWARARAAQAAVSPATWSVFPATIERRLKIFRCGNEVEAFISAADTLASNCSGLLSHVGVFAVVVPPTHSQRTRLSGAPGGVRAGYAQGTRWV